MTLAAERYQPRELSLENVSAGRTASPEGAWNALPAKTFRGRKLATAPTSVALSLFHKKPTAPRIIMLLELHCQMFVPLATNTNALALGAASVFVATRAAESVPYDTATVLFAERSNPSHGSERKLNVGRIALPSLSIGIRAPYT